jgi:hypothetical protein
MLKKIERVKVILMVSWLVLVFGGLALFSILQRYNINIFPCLGG